MADTYVVFPKPSGGGGPTTVEWGDIEGLLSNQADLVAALAAKAPLASPTFTGTVTLPTTNVGANMTVTGGAATDGYLVGTALKLWNDASGAVMSATGPILQALTGTGGHFIGYGANAWRWASQDVNTMSLSTALLTLLNNQPIRFGAGAPLVEIGKIGASDPRVYISSGLTNGPLFDIDNGKITPSQDLDSVLHGMDGASPKALTLRAGNSSGANDGADLTLTGGTSVSGDQGSVVLISGPVPATASSPGVAGTVAFDNDYIYRCIATNTWVRAAMTTWV